MENKLSKRICSLLLKWGVITAELEEVYIYGFELLISFLFSTFTVLLIGALLHQMICTLIFLLIFIFVRQFTGGYHAKTYFRCQFCTISSYLIVLTLSLNTTIPIWAFLILGIVGLTVIGAWGPIENPHKPLTINEKRKHKLTGFILFVSTSIIGSLVCLFNSKLSNVIFYTLTLIIALMIIPKLSERRKKHEKEDRKTCC